MTRAPGPAPGKPFMRPMAARPSSHHDSDRRLMTIALPRGQGVATTASSQRAGGHRTCVARTNRRLLRPGSWSTLLSISDHASRRGLVPRVDRSGHEANVAGPDKRFPCRDRRGHEAVPEAHVRASMKAGLARRDATHLRFAKLEAHTTGQIVRDVGFVRRGEGRIPAHPSAALASDQPSGMRRRLYQRGSLRAGSSRLVKTAQISGARSALLVLVRGSSVRAGRAAG
jgi:hypothetical protein